MSETVDHSEHGKGHPDYGPDDPDCPCRGSEHEKQCAESGCGFCVCSVQKSRLNFGWTPGTP